MKATGIIRRVDDLGRVVIPKEIRRTLGIHEGDALEVYVEDGSVIFHKYSHTIASDIQRIDGMLDVVIEDYRDKQEAQNALKKVIEILNRWEEE